MADFTTEEITKLKAIAKKEKDDDAKKAINEACAEDIKNYIQTREAQRDQALADINA